MNGRPANPKYARNKNVLVIGGSGSGKTRFYVKPNLMQMHSSYCVTDPKGTIVLECGKMLEDNGYEIKILNTINFKKSMKYNPFAYLRSEKDILKLVQTIIANTKGEGEKAGEDFWVKAEKLYYTALIGYIFYEAPREEKNFATLLDMIDASEVREDNETYMNPIDRLFEALEKKEPTHFAVKQYKKYKLAAGKTAKSILISCGARLAPFDIQELRDLMKEDELELDTLGDRKTALFVIISDTDDTFNFVVSIMYSQLFNLLCDKADDVYGGRLPVHVRCLLDEFANIGLIPKFEKLIATIRSREISGSARAAVILVDMWKDIPFFAILILAALQFIPGEIYEAAKIDGSGPIRTFFSVTLPNIAKTLLSQCIFFILWRITSFDLVYAMTSGGPGDSTTLLSYRIMLEAFNNLNPGYASAISVILFILMAIVAGINLTALKKIGNK